MYSRNNSYYCFCLTINSADMKKTYFFIKKTLKEVEDLGNDNHQSLITFQEDQFVHVVMCNDLKGAKKEVLTKYLKTMTFKQLQDRLKGNTDNKDPTAKVEEPISPYQINLTFETLYDMQTSIDFLPFIY